MDKVEASNLNRQYYFRDDIGKRKVLALASLCSEINPDIRIELFDTCVTKVNISSIFASVDVMIEAFDRAETKKMLIDYWCRTYHDIPLICASGISGYGESESIGITNMGNVWFIGDGKTDMSMGLCAPRIAIAANMQANLVISILMNRNPKDDNG
jgi:sulfur carrier protein ThiS adenylyltransferase